MLQLEDRVGVEEVELAVAAPLVLAAPFQIVLADRPDRERALMPPADLLGDDGQADAADA